MRYGGVMIMCGIDKEKRLYIALECPLHHADGIAGIFGIHGVDEIFLRHTPVFRHVSPVGGIF